MGLLGLVSNERSLSYLLPSRRVTSKGAIRLVRIVRAPAVILACRWAEPEMVDLLLALGARVGAAPRGVTARHYAAWGGRAEIARRLVDAGAPLSTRDEEYGASPLGWAGHFGNREVAEYLTGAGAE